jgi:hypothetical protein
MRQLLTEIFEFEISNDEVENECLSKLGFEIDSEVNLELVEDALDNIIRIWRDCVSMNSAEGDSEQLKKEVFSFIQSSTLWPHVTEQMSFSIPDAEPLPYIDNPSEPQSNQLAVQYLSIMLSLDLPVTSQGAPEVESLTKIYDRILVMQKEQLDDASQIIDDLDTEGALEISTPLQGRPDLTWTVGKLLEGIEEGEIDFPLWQRKGDAWSLTKKRNLVRSILVGIPLPTMIVHRRNDGVMEVIDGRQRLTTLGLFADDKFKTANYKAGFQPMTAATATPPGFNLQAYSGKKYSEIVDVKITDANGTERSIGRHIEQSPVPLLIFDNLTSQQLYFIFTVYNTNSTPLNDAEIRNAVYHEHPLHRMMMDLSGDSEPEYVEVDGVKQRVWEYPEFTPSFRRLLSPKDAEPTRFKAVSFLARYAAYSIPTGAFRDNGRLVKDSNKKHIHELMESTNDIEEDELRGLAVEISNAFLLCNTIHLETGYQPYHTQTTAGRDTFNGVKAIASLTAAGILIAAQVKYELTIEQIKSVIIAFEESVEFPEKQYAGPTWGYHLGVVEVTRQKLVELEADPIGLRGGRFDKLLEEARAHTIEQQLIEERGEQ